MGEKQVYRSLRDDSPVNDSSLHENGTKSNDSANVMDGTPSSNGHYRKNCDKKQTNSKDSKRRVNSAGGILPMVYQTGQTSTAVTLLANQHAELSNGQCQKNVCMTPPPIKTQSLPMNSSINDMDAIILSALRITPEELAGQITLLDLPAFSSIVPDELTSCAWTKKDKYTVAPNIVAFTKRFNHTSFWTIQEILSGPTPKRRAEIMAHFIKVSTFFNSCSY